MIRALAVGLFLLLALLFALSLLVRREQPPVERDELDGEGL